MEGGSGYPKVAVQLSAMKPTLVGRGKRIRGFWSGSSPSRRRGEKKRERERERDVYFGAGIETHCLALGGVDYYYKNIEP